MGAVARAYLEKKKMEDRRTRWMGGMIVPTVNAKEDPPGDYEDETPDAEDFVSVFSRMDYGDFKDPRDDLIADDDDTPSLAKALKARRRAY